MRTFFIWLTGILFCSIVGGGIGDWVNPYAGGAFWGVLAGALAFTCFRLWVAPQRV